MPSRSRDNTGRNRVDRADDFKRIYERSAVGIFRSTLDGRYLSANPAAVRMHGYESEAELLRAVRGIGEEVYCDPGDRETLRRLLEEQGSVEGFECQIYRHKTGESFWVRQNIYRIDDSEGRIQYIEGHVEDITDRKHVEQELRRYRDEMEQRVEERSAQLKASERRYRTIFDTSAAGIGRTWLKDGRLILSNGKLAEIFGYDSVEEFVEDFVFSERYADLEDRARLMASYEKSPGTPVECRWKRKDGSFVFVQAYAIANYEEGFLDFVAVDITDRKWAEQALLESEERLIQAVDLAGLGHCVWDAVEDCCIYCSEDHARIHGMSVADYMAKASTLGGEFAMVHPEDRVRIKAEYHALRSGKELEQEYRLVTPAGETRYVREVAKPVLDAGGDVVQEIVTIQDITVLKQAEERLRQAQKMEAVGQLTGGVAHDFNNLLAVIEGNGALLAKRLGQERKELSAIFRAASRGAELTQRLLAFSRQQPLQPQPTDLAVLTAGMKDLLERTLGATIALQLHVDGDPAPAMADPGQVESALLNLVLNARDAMPDGGRLTIESADVRLDEVFVAEDPEVRAGDYVVLAVSDEGVGMPAEVRSHAFEPFYTTKEFGKGSGLGLSMVYGFAKQSGGHVSIYSEVAKGTTVKLYLPRADTAAKPEAAPAHEEVPPGRGELLLVVEDDPDVRAITVDMLEDLSYRVIDVPDAASAREVLADGQRVDMVLSDVVLPGGTSGPDLAEAVAATRPDLKFLFMSGYPAESAKYNGFLGSDRVLLNKPFSRHELATALREALD